jgi:hypothetical protein
MSGTSPPRNVIYFFSRANQIPSAGIGDLPYTDVIIAFLVPDDDLNLHGSGGAFDEKSPRRVIRNSPAQAFADHHLIVSKVLIPATARLKRQRPPHR